MLISYYDSNVNLAYNHYYTFHDLKTKDSLTILKDLEETLNLSENKFKVAKSVCGATLIDGKLSYISLSDLKYKYPDKYNNLIEVYTNLYNVSLSSIKYGDMIISYDEKFYVSGNSPIENIRNIVYNVLSVSILEDYKKL